eukprot:SAG11_NODE_772_length_7254_cov_1.857582_9_plen_92_part_00
MEHVPWRGTEGSSFPLPSAIRQSCRQLGRQYHIVRGSVVRVAWCGAESGADLMGVSRRVEPTDSGSPIAVRARRHKRRILWASAMGSLTGR